VADEIYVSSERIHQLVYSLAPGGAFRHSAAYRTIFAADVVYYVLGGTLVLSNPQTGEVHLVRAGEAACFGPDTWHHAFNYGGEPVRVLELFAPPPSQGTAGTYAQTKPLLAASRYTQDQWLGRWPAARAQAESGFTITVVREGDLLWRLEGEDRPALVGLLVSTARLTAGKVRLLPGGQSAVHAHGGDESLYVVQGTLHVRLPEHEGQRWFELAPADGFYIPQGVAHQYYNIGGEPVEVMFGVAPGYLPPEA
jgi:quercetin dioxygenase-like cupin family protein